MFYSIFKGDRSAWSRLLTAHRFTEFDTYVIQGSKYWLSRDKD